MKEIATYFAQWVDIITQNKFKNNRGVSHD